MRDTINTKLERNMAKPVTTDYAFLKEPRDKPELGPVTLEETAWCVWFLEMGRFCYPSADMVTYLYPKAIEEARGIGAPSTSTTRVKKTARSCCRTVCSSRACTRRMWGARLPGRASWRRVAGTCGVSCLLRVWCPLRDSQTS